MINFNLNEKQDKNNDSNNQIKNQKDKRNINLISNEDLDQICLDNINDLLY